MRHRVYGAHARASHWRNVAPEIIIALALSLMMIVPQAGAAAMRFQERSLYMNNTDPGATTYYKISFKFMSDLPVGSVDMLFCKDPIPYHACVPPEGLNVSSATLESQTGERGFSATVKSSNHLVLSRTSAAVPVDKESSYVFDNIKNPTDETESFSIRLRSHQSLDASGPQIDFGSLKGQVSSGIMLATQVPPMLIFCLAEQVEDNCAGTNETHYKELGQLSSSATLSTQSQMAVGTNASGGFSITVNGTPMSAGVHTINSPTIPTISSPGVNQFGINLVANSSPTIGKDPEGDWANAVVASGYDEPDKFKYVSGDVVAYSPNVSLMKKFTVSYMINSSADLRAGVYSTTLTYIASGRF